jgi:hypothetical protein
LKNNIATIAVRPALISSQKPLLTLYNSLVHSQSKNIPIYVAIFNKYIALKDREIHKSHFSNMEQHVESEEANKTNELQQIMEVKKRFEVSLQQPSIQPVIFPDGTTSNITSTLHRKPLDIGNESDSEDTLI